MLPKPNRLPSPDIRRVMRTGRRVNTNGAQLVVAPSALPVSRFAFVVPVGIDKRAVVRNCVRRVLRESVRLILPKLAPGWDGVFFVRKGLGDEFTAVANVVREVLRRAGILVESKIT